MLESPHASFGARLSGAGILLVLILLSQSGIAKTIITINGNGVASPLTVAQGSTVTFTVKVTGCPQSDDTVNGDKAWFDLWNEGATLTSQPTVPPNEWFAAQNGWFFTNNAHTNLLEGFDLGSTDPNPQNPCKGPTSPVTYTFPNPGIYTIWYGFSQYDAQYVCNVNGYPNCFFPCPFNGCYYFTYGPGDDTQLLATDQSSFTVIVAGALAGFSITPATTAASTCVPDPITITALDSQGQPLTTYTGTIVLSTSSGHGNWSIDQGQGILTPGPADSGTADYTFSSADQGTVILYLADTHADDLTITATDLVAGVTGTSSAIAFRDNAFVFTPENPPADGPDVVVAGRPETIGVAMIDRNPTTGSCGPAPGYDTASVMAWITRSTSDPGGPAPTANGVPLPNTLPLRNNLLIAFTNGTATFTLGTTDVGQWTINFEDDTSGYALNLANQSRTISGSSPELTVRPFGFAFSNLAAGGVANPGTTTPTGAIFTHAGLPFSATVSAVAWISSDPADGVPTGPIDLATHPITRFFAWQSTLSASAPYTPTQGVLGTLNNGTLAPTAFQNGVATATNLNYSEVGSMSLDGLATNYLNAGVSVTGLSDPVGRFTPDHFDVTVNQPTFTSSCGSNFSYLGQPLNYSTAPVVTITAVDAEGATTLNYSNYGSGNNWWKLPNIIPTYGDPNIPAGLGITVDSGLAAFSPATTSNTAPGSVTTTFSGPLSYTLPDTGATPAPIASPFSSDITVSFPVKDTDGIVASPKNPFTFTVGFAAGDASTIRQGRLLIPNAYGSEELDLNDPMVTQYYLGASTGWVNATNDQCTTGVTLSLIEPAGGGPIVPTDTCVWEVGNQSGLSCGSGKTGEDFSEPPANGNFNLWFKAPNVTGPLLLKAQTLPSWLEYDWNGTGQDNQAPEGTLNFGLYHANPAQIYWYEIY
ncbi:MAG: DUF6701 domain-containing protein [Gammaproteobacteria bacterium]